MRHADCLPRFHHARALAALFVLFLASLMLAGCASLAYREPVRINVVGLEPIPGEGMEMRFKVKLRVQNPNETAIDFDGLALDLDLNGRPFASGVSDRAGSVARFGEALIEIPVSVSAILRGRSACSMTR